MAQGVRRQRHLHAAAQRMLLDQLPEHLPRHWPTACRHEQGVAQLPTEDLRAAFGEVAAQPCMRFLAEWDEALLGPLAGRAQRAVGEAQVNALQADQFADAQAARVHQLEHRAVAQSERRVDIGRAKQCLDLRFAQALRHAQRLLGRQQPQRRVGAREVLAHGPAEVALEDGQPPVAARRLAAGVARDRVVAQVGFGRLIEAARVALAEPLCVQREVTPISGQRVGRQAVFDPQRIDESVYRFSARDFARHVTPASASAFRPPACRPRTRP